jgi:hypothetical protein
MDPACPNCAGKVAYRNGRRFADTWARLGVESISLLTITRDPDRFPDPLHLLSDAIPARVMAVLWRQLAKHSCYAEHLGLHPEPTWICCREVHEGKRSADGGDGSARGSIHAHCYIPAPSANGRLLLPVLEAVRAFGVELSGRTSWGWTRQKKYVMAVADGTDYATKGMRYATKGGKILVSEAIASRVRFTPMTRSRSCSGPDPRNLMAARRRELRGKRDADLVEFDRLIAGAGRREHHTYGSWRREKKQLCELRAALSANKRGGRGSRGPQRTRLDRRAACRQSVQVLELPDESTGLRYPVAVRKLDRPWDEFSDLVLELLGPCHVGPMDLIFSPSGQVVADFEELAGRAGGRLSLTREFAETVLDRVGCSGPSLDPSDSQQRLAGPATPVLAPACSGPPDEGPSQPGPAKSSVARSAAQPFLAARQGSMWYAWGSRLCKKPHFTFPGWAYTSSAGGLRKTICGGVWRRADVHIQNSRWRAWATGRNPAGRASGAGRRLAAGAAGRNLVHGRRFVTEQERAASGP